MDLILTILGLILLVVGYFCLGMVAKFFLGWWILAFGLPILLIVGLTMDWIGAIAAVVGFFVLLHLNSEWQGCERYMALERRIDKAFYFSDT
ncbi:hypothetical protein ACFPTO_12390 [Paraburkholderia denitrificans]|uniref:Uncharacterized protein n=1 Tax=Paraburkholderia denitrificans TaxID=694025 RepID=A0ABW0J9I4_9BURK